MKNIKFSEVELQAQSLFNSIRSKFEKGDFDGIQKMLDPVKGKGVIEALKEFKKIESTFKLNQTMSENI